MREGVRAAAVALAGRAAFITARAGLPATTACAGTSLITTAPADTMLWSPIVTPGWMMARPPIQTLSPIVMGLHVVRPR